MAGGGSHPIGSAVDGLPVAAAPCPRVGSDKRFSTLAGGSAASSALAIKPSESPPVDHASSGSGAVPIADVLQLPILEPAAGPASSSGGSREGAPEGRGARFPELDSMRGMAAATVVLCHLLNTVLAVYDRPGELWTLKYTPLHIFWAGHQAVVFFFVLSGFVLALPFYSGPVSYRAFLVKRVCRIYIPYWAAVLVAVIAYHSFGHQGAAGSSSWINKWWSEPLSYRLLLGHLLLVDSFRNNVLDPVIWSLVHEMRISLVFPLLMAFLLQHRWQTTLLAAAALGIVGVAISRGSVWLGHENDYGQTLGYVLMFAVGALLCRHRTALIAWFQALPAILRWAGLALAILAYTYPFWALPSVRLLHLSLIDDWVTTAGIAVFIVAGLASPTAGRVLRLPPLRWLGSVSYSLYLFHAIVLLALLNLLLGVVPLWWIWTLTVVLGLACAVAGHQLLERPSIALGRRLAVLISARAWRVPSFWRPAGDTRPPGSSGAPADVPVRVLQAGVVVDCRDEPGRAQQLVKKLPVNNTCSPR